MSDTYLNWLSNRTPGAWWVDTGVSEEIDASRAENAVGVTMNPLLLARGLVDAQSGTREIVAAGGALPPAGPERAIEITRRVSTAIAGRFAELFDSSAGESGWVCAQVDPSLADDATAMVGQAKEFSSWAPNVLVKLPVTEAGIEALEECVGDGISITATVSFSLPQVIASAEAHARGARTAADAGREAGRCYSVAMLGRLDDHLKRVANGVADDVIDRAGIAVAKRARSLFAERGYGAIILPSGMRHIGHVTELAGGSFVYSISPAMATELATTDLSFDERVERDVETGVLEQLKSIPDFVRAYEPDGIAPRDFASFGAAEFTLEQFAREGWAVLEGYEAG